MPNTIRYRWPFPLAAMTLLLATLSAASLAAPPLQLAAGIDDLQGYWEGKGPGGDCAVTISGDSLQFWARPDFWYETTFTVPGGDDPLQLHATILEDSTGRDVDIGKVVVALFEIEGDRLTLGVVDDFQEKPVGSVEGDWEWVTDVYRLERAEPPTS